MINLDVEDRKQLITLLKDLPELATERSRYPSWRATTQYRSGACHFCKSLVKVRK